MSVIQCERGAALSGSSLESNLALAHWQKYSVVFCLGGPLATYSSILHQARQQLITFHAGKITGCSHFATH
jgi:hypothetical protein